jgi:hypothetical protein
MPNGENPLPIGALMFLHDRIPKAMCWAVIELARWAERNIRLMYKRQGGTPDYVRKLVPACAGMT